MESVSETTSAPGDIRIVRSDSSKNYDYNITILRQDGTYKEEPINDKNTKIRLRKGIKAEVVKLSDNGMSTITLPIMDVLTIKQKIQEWTDIRNHVGYKNKEFDFSEVY